LAFGAFEVNAAAGELLKSGVRIRLSSQPFQILLTLLAHPGEVVTSEQLREQVWPDGTFVDFEHGLHAAVNKLRRVLGESAENPRYVETVPGRGYRFIGAVERGPHTPISSRSGAVPTLVPSPRPPQDTGELSRLAHFKLRRRWWTAAALTLVVGGLSIWVTAHFRQRPNDERSFSLQIASPDGSDFAFGANSSGISLSPDGKMAAYIAADKGNTALWVRPLEGTSARRVAGTEGAGLPFWSPNSQSIAFFAQGKLQRVELAGGAPQTICDVGLAPGGSWGSDGQILFGGWGSSLFQVSASGGQPKPLTTLNASRGEVFHYWPQILPGGRFLYFVRSHKRENTGVYAASLANPNDAAQLLATDANALYAPGAHDDRKGHLLWLRGATLVAQDFDVDELKLSGVPHPVADPVARMAVHGQMQVAVSATGLLMYSPSAPLRQLTWVDRTGKPIGTAGEPTLSAHLQLSPDGRRAVVTRVNPDGGDLWILDLERGVWNRFTSKPGINIYPIWSPDGRTILYASDAPFNLFRKDASGANGEQRLTQSPNPQFPMDWSRDGRFILYEEDNASGDRRSLWVLPVAPGNKARPYLPARFNQYMGRFSPDTRWVAFQSDESGRYEVYIDAFPEPRGKVRISTGGGVLPHWAPGGRELYYVSPDSMLMSVSLKVGTGSIEPSVPHALFRLPVQDADISPYDPAPDGQRFLVVAAEHAAPLTVIVNWPALLSKAPNAQ
jgi:Tol biopolymer transport system component/DNA-binding winged helix-turn-helix (wHTH) protein